MSEHICDKEECRFCQVTGEYFDFDENGIFSLCKKHVVSEASS